jgi:hypothetical protein
VRDGLPTDGLIRLTGYKLETFCQPADDNYVTYEVVVSAYGEPVRYVPSNRGERAGVSWEARPAGLSAPELQAARLPGMVDVAKGRFGLLRSYAGRGSIHSISASAGWLAAESCMVDEPDGLRNRHRNLGHGRFESAPGYDFYPVWVTADPRSL